MKRILTISTIICTALSLSYSQHSMHTLNAMGFFMNSSYEFLNTIPGKEYIEGSPYLTEEFQTGSLHYNKEWYEDLELKYDIYQDHFEVTFDEEIKIIDPYKNDIDSIVHLDEIFVRKAYYVGNSRVVSYMAFLGEFNNFSFYKLYKINVKEAKPVQGYSDAEPAKFVPTSPSYYLFSEEDQWIINGTKDIAEVFNIEVKTVKSYLKENRLKLKREHDLIAIVQYFSIQ